MKKLYVLASSVMNGTVTMRTDHACFTNIELAEKVAEVIREKNADHGVEIWNQIEEAVVYENAEEVPILNDYKQTKKE